MVLLKWGRIRCLATVRISATGDDICIVKSTCTEAGLHTVQQMCTTASQNFMNFKEKIPKKQKETMCV